MLVCLKMVCLGAQMVVLGSDGREYPFLAKPKDDLRKDHRMMEVAGVLNRLFAKEPASRRRNLYIRRWAHLLLLAGRMMRDGEHVLVASRVSVPA